MNYRSYQRSQKSQINRISFLIVIVTIFFLGIVARLFYLQILKAAEYKIIAKDQYYSDIVIPQKRGEILSIDYKTGQYNKLATNTTLDLLYIDPTETPDKMKVAEILAPLIFTEEDYVNCKKNNKLCPKGNTVEFNTIYVNEETNITNNSIKSDQDTRTWEQLIEAYKQDIYRKISQKEIEFVPLSYNSTPQTMSGVIALNLQGIHVNTKNNLIYANPVEIREKAIRTIAQKLAVLLDIPIQQLQNMLRRRDVRYIPLKRKLAPEISDKIWELKFKYKDEHLKNRDNIPNYFKGVVLLPEHWRYYPDKTLASQIIGFVNHEGIGQYGIEGNFNIELQGQKGHNISQKDVFGSQVSIDETQIVDAVDGNTIVLTIDRVIQQKTEELLEAAIKKFRADSGQIIIMDPFTGKIIALVNAPGFDPNQFGNVYKKRQLSKYEKIPHSIRVFLKNDKEQFILAKKSERDNHKLDRYVFENHLGEGVYLNKGLQEIYEPGSVFKPLVMAAAIDAGEVTPQTKFLESGPLEVETGTDEKQYIHTALGQYNGWQTMTNVLETSSNVGMAFVAKQLGKTLFYKYIKDYGFGELSDIELEGEEGGTVIYYKKWSLAKLYTTSFGQGLNATLVQMGTAWCVLANGGLLMQPHIVDSIIENNNANKITKIEPEIIRRVISADTASTISAMLVSAVKNGVAKPAEIKNYKFAGKTGTAQIAKTNGIGYEKGEGSTITSFAGYAPIEHPRFVIIIKIDRPRIGENTWGSTTAAPVFKEITEFLLDYYDIPPNEK